MTDFSYDVVVLGAGAAGIPAAVQAARTGARTLLVEKTARLGGTTTNGGVSGISLFHAWGKQIIAGIGWEMVEKAVAEAGGSYPDFDDHSQSCLKHSIKINPDVYAAICDDTVLEAGVDLLLHTMLGAAEADGDGWTLTLCTKSGLESCRTKQLIDCSGDADAVAMAGGPLLFPDWCQPSTLVCRLSGYDPDALDFDTLNARFKKAIDAGVVQALDACWKIDRPEVERWLRNRGVNANHILSDTEARTSRGRTALEVEGRRSIRRITNWLRKQPGLESLRVDRVCPELGVRETVQIEGETVVTYDDYVSGRVFPDAVCYGYYPIDQHGIRKGMGKFELLAEGVVPTVPLGALIPKGMPNLFAAGRIISADRLAFSALRVQATCMATGQAAGAAAALAARDGVASPNVEVDAVRDLLAKHGAIVPETSGEA